MNITPNLGGLTPDTQVSTSVAANVEQLLGGLGNVDNTGVYQLVNTNALLGLGTNVAMTTGADQAALYAVLKNQNAAFGLGGLDALTGQDNQGNSTDMINQFLGPNTSTTSIGQLGSQVANINSQLLNNNQNGLLKNNLITNMNSGSQLSLALSVPPGTTPTGSTAATIAALGGNTAQTDTIASLEALVGIGAGAGTGKTTPGLPALPNSTATGTDPLAALAGLTGLTGMGLGGATNTAAPQLTMALGAAPAGNYAGGSEDQVLMGLFGIMMTLIMKLIDKVGDKPKQPPAYNQAPPLPMATTQAPVAGTAAAPVLPTLPGAAVEVALNTTNPPVVGNITTVDTRPALTAVNNGQLTVGQDVVNAAQQNPNNPQVAVDTAIAQLGGVPDLDSDAHVLAAYNKIFNHNLANSITNIQVARDSLNGLQERIVPMLNG